MSFVLYSTLGCHLCEDAEALLSPIANALGLSWKIIEISEDEALVELYGIRIPVIKSLKTEAELGWPFDEVQLADWLQAQLDE